MLGEALVGRHSHDGDRVPRRVRVRVALVVALSVVCALAVASAAPGQALSGTVALRQLSEDPFTNATSQHRTQVEPDSFAAGSTIVTAFQSGRFFDGGSTDIGWATSRDGATTWAHGFLPGLTKFVGTGPYDRASDPSVAYDARHKVWMISSLGLTESGSAASGTAVVVSRSIDGAVTWKSPVVVATGTDLDKNWTVCDNTTTSAHYGNCYTEYDAAGAGGSALRVSVSNDGGLSWIEATVPVAPVVGGQPVVQPDGTVVVPIASNGGPPVVESFVSTDGGSTLVGPYVIADTGPNYHPVAGNLRAGNLPSAEVDAAGRVYVVWADCRFRAACAVNDIVMSTSTDGVTWSSVARVPIDATGSGVDHFIPGLAVDATTHGASTRLALAYYYYPNGDCTTSTCHLEVGFISSDNGGGSWTSPTRLTGPMSLGWLADTSGGPMVGDYISTSFVDHVARPVFAVARASSGGSFDEAIDTTAPPASPPPPHKPPPPSPSATGYWMVGADGSVYAFGHAHFLGSATTLAVTHLEPTPSHAGYWIVNAVGRVFAFGNARWFGNAAALLPGETVSSLSATPTANGYWLFTSRGRALPFGDARFFGDMSGTVLNGPVVGSVATPTGRGYYMVASDGGIFSFGDARFHGSIGGTRLNKPVNGLVPTLDNRGYWLVASDGGIFAFNARFRGSMGSARLNRPVVGMVRYGNGYLMVASDGGIFDFSNLPFAGSLGTHAPAVPIVGVGAIV